MAEVALTNVSKTFSGGVQAVHDLTLLIPHGKFAVLLGPSGCGKTTTLRIIAGLEEPNTGEVRIGGRLVNQDPPQRRDVAVVFQSYALYPHMTVAMNMGFGLKMRGISRIEIQEKVLETSRLLGLENLLDRYPGQLSGGQRQRVALGRAIVRNPAVFLLDEPLSNLDAQLRTDTRVELLKLQRRLEGTFVYVTHDQVEAMTLADIIIVMHNGIKQQIDSPREIYAKPANTFVAAFIGSPKMNLLKGLISKIEDGISINFNTFTLSIPKKYVENNRDMGNEVTFGVRPEHILTFSPEDKRTQVIINVEVVEMLGSQQFIYGSINGSQQLTVGVDPLFPVNVGDNVGLKFPFEAIHFFNSETGLRI